MPDHIEQVAPGLTLETRHNGRLYLWTITSMSQVTIDAWFDRGIQIVQNLKPGEENCALYDLSNAGMPTPYLQHRLKEFTHGYGKQLAGCSAYVLKRSPVHAVLKMALKHEMQRHYKNVDFKIFHNRQEALAWLEDQFVPA